MATNIMRAVSIPTFHIQRVRRDLSISLSISQSDLMNSCLSFRPAYHEQRFEATQMFMAGFKAACSRKGIKGRN